MVSQHDTAKMLKDILRDAVKDTTRPIAVDILVGVQEPAEDCIEQLREVYAIARECHKQCYEQLQSVRKKFKVDCNQQQLIDVIYLLREISNTFEDLRKEFSRAKSDSEYTICERHSADATQPDSYFGKFATGNCYQRETFDLPTFSKDPEGYNYLCDWLGIPEDLRDKGKELWAAPHGEMRTKIVEPDYNGFNDMIEKYRVFAAQARTAEERAVFMIPERIEAMRRPNAEPKVRIAKRPGIEILAPTSND